MKRVFTCFFPFCGLGAGALGFLQARVQLRGEELSFRSLGGIDNDPLACEDFEYLTDSPALCADMKRLTSGELRAFAGEVPPDVVFTSAPCKGASGLLSARAARLPKYAAMNRLALDWVELMLSTWDVPPRLLLFENVPRIVSRAKGMLDKLKSLLRKAGYLWSEQTHDCGELGGLAQHRTRYLGIARHPERCPPLLYQPPPMRVRACGEVLGELPLPGDPSAGPMHELPKLSWLNSVRLSLIPAGGDWRDLDGVLKGGQRRREVHRRHRVEEWAAPSATVAGSGSNSAANVADPRVEEEYRGQLGVIGWNEPSGVITGSAAPSRGRFAVADERAGRMGVLDWSAPSGAVLGESLPSNGAFAIADGRFGNVERVSRWEDPVGVITSSPAPSSGAGAVADPRIPQAGNENLHWSKYKVTSWDDPAQTVIGAGRVGSGAPSVGDPRIGRNLARGYSNIDHVLSWSAPAQAITGAVKPSSGAPSVADPRAAARKLWEQKGIKTPGEVHWFKGKYGVTSWESPARTVIGGPSNGVGAIADPRVLPSPHFGETYGVSPWNEPSVAITGMAAPSRGMFSVADPRLLTKAAYPHSYGVLRWDEAASTIAGGTQVGQGAYAVADGRWTSFPIMDWRDAEATILSVALTLDWERGEWRILDHTKPHPRAWIIISADGTWHRALTTLELAVLQSLPARHKGAPLKLAGNASGKWRERIGNAVPPAAARAMAEQMLVCLAAAKAGTWQLSGGGAVWVEHESAMQ